MTEDKKITIEFAPGCFDNFEGTQEELDAFVDEIKRLAESGELLEKSTELDFEDFEELDDNTLEHIASVLKNAGEERNRKLN